MTTTNAPRRRARTSQRKQKKSRNPLVYVGQVAAVVSLITGVLSLVFIVRPGCQPTAPVDRGTGSIDKVDVLPMTFRNFLRKQELAPMGYSKEKLREAGVMVNFHYQLNGFRGKTLPLHWELDDAVTNAVVAQNDPGGFNVIRPSSNDESRTFAIFVPVPQTRRSYYVVGKLLQPSGTKQALVDDFTTKTFPGLRGQG